MRRPLPLALLLLASACGDDARTQIMVTIDADPEVKRVARIVDVSIYGGVRAEGALPSEGPQEVPLSVVASDAWPLTVALAPKDGDASRLFRIVVAARGPTGETLTEVRAISGYVEGQVLWLRLYIDAACLGADPCLDPTTTCQGGECVDATVDAKDLPPWAGRGPDAGVDGGPACSSTADCDDRVSCTVDTCDDSGRCAHTPDDASCTAGPGGWCDPVGGCQYAECTAATCAAEDCQEAACDGTRCVRTHLCTGEQTCCAGGCVAPGCDDGNPCTDDACGASGCEHTPNGAACDDGAFCNGADTCAAGACTVHAGDPCPGSSTCDEGSGACVGCLGPGDCPTESEVDLTACGSFTGICDETGEKAVSVTSYTCVAGTCAGADRTEMRPCTRDTDGTSCGSTTDTGPCVPTFPCSTTGTRTTIVTPRTCVSGSCTDGLPSSSVSSCTVTPPGSCLDAGTPDAGAGDGSTGSRDACAPVSSSETICYDGVDDDCDGFVDCDDCDCRCDSTPCSGG